MSRRTQLLLAVILAAIAVSAVPAAARERIPLPSARFIMPVEATRDESDLDAVYRLVVELFLARYPECERLHGYHRLTPGGTTAVITIRCTAIRRFVTERLDTEAEPLRLVFLLSFYARTHRS